MSIRVVCKKKTMMQRAIKKINFLHIVHWFVQFEVQMQYIVKLQVHRFYVKSSHGSLWQFSDYLIWTNVSHDLRLSNN